MGSPAEVDDEVTGRAAVIILCSALSSAVGIPEVLADGVCSANTIYLRLRSINRRDEGSARLLACLLALSPKKKCVESIDARAEFMFLLFLQWVGVCGKHLYRLNQVGAWGLGWGGRCMYRTVVVREFCLHGAQRRSSTVEIPTATLAVCARLPALCR